MIFPYQFISASTAMEQWIWIVCTSQWNGAVQGSLMFLLMRRSDIWWSCSELTILNSTSYAEASGCCLGSATLLPARSHSPFSIFFSLQVLEPCALLTCLSSSHTVREKQIMLLHFLKRKLLIFCYCIKYLSLQKNKVNSKQNAQYAYQ